MPGGSRGGRLVGMVVRGMSGVEGTQVAKCISYSKSSVLLFTVYSTEYRSV